MIRCLLFKWRSVNFVSLLVRAVPACQIWRKPASEMEGAAPTLYDKCAALLSQGYRKSMGWKRWLM